MKRWLFTYRDGYKVHIFKGKFFDCFFVLFSTLQKQKKKKNLYRDKVVGRATQQRSSTPVIKEVHKFTNSKH